MISQLNNKTLLTSVNLLNPSYLPISPFGGPLELKMSKNIVRSY